LLVVGFQFSVVGSMESGDRVCIDPNVFKIDNLLYIIDVQDVTSRHPAPLLLHVSPTSHAAGSDHGLRFTDYIAVSLLAIRNSSGIVRAPNRRNWRSLEPKTENRKLKTENSFRRKRLSRISMHPIQPPWEPSSFTSRGRGVRHSSLQHFGRGITEFTQRLTVAHRLQYLQQTPSLAMITLCCQSPLTFKIHIVDKGVNPSRPGCDPIEIPPDLVPFTCRNGRQHLW
jgi:hypothetical protein